MNNLPLDLQIQIFTFLPVSYIEKKVKLISKFHNGLVNEFKSSEKKSNYLWESLIKRDFPNSKRKEEWINLPLNKVYHLLEKEFPELSENDENFYYEKRIYKLDEETYKREAKLLSYSDIIDKKGRLFYEGQIYQVLDYKLHKYSKNQYFEYWHLFLKHIFTGEEIDFEFYKVNDLIHEPEPKFEKYSLIDIEEGYVTLMNENGETRSDLRLPRGKNGKDIKKRFENGEDLQVMVMKICGEEEIYSVSKQSIQNPQ